MSLRSYAEYKDSGVPWLGRIPSHWKLQKTKYLFDLMSREVREEDGIVTAFRDGQVTLRSKRRSEGFTNAIKEIGYQGVRAGDLVIHAMDAFAGAIGVSDSDGKSTPVYSVCQPRTNANPYYFAHNLRYMASSGFINSLAKGIRERSTDFRWNDAGGLSLPLPEKLEQDQIVSFLDRETAKIDALIAEQETLLALLAEKRQATISHAVTRGLDPDVPMKDSGIAWLGEVPAHWGFRRLRTLCEFTTSGPRGWSERIGESGSLFIQSGDLGDAMRLDFENAKRVEVGDDAEAERTRLADGDVLVCITGAKTGNVAVCNVVPEIAYVNQHLCLIRPTSEVLPIFLALVLKSRVGQVQMEIAQYGLKQGLSLENVRAVFLMIPPIEEQRRIVAFLDAETCKHDLLKNEAEIGIKLLTERRSALIAAAVTGKIDVRGQVEAQAA